LDEIYYNTKLTFIVENWNVYQSISDLDRHRTNFVVAAFYNEDESSDEELALDVQEDFNKLRVKHRDSS
jgi:hypothetical protein